MTDKKLAPKNVDDYMMQLAPDVARALTDLRTAIRAAAPEAQEVMRMGAVTYLHRGNLVSFAAASKHCSFYVMSPGPIATRRDALKGFETAPTAIKFKSDRPLPAALVQAIVHERMRENEAK
ncbi:MAG TPA: DUF1801 domain-containing protein [Devosia sp.]